ncbi:LysR family transcriptional regulator [Sphingomonas sp. BK235]|uniref:LysR family transcriptional regulator n=1 Tax=Sphingomonas sp. BK235 TaxID=2512131 RepID=UPI00104AD024|nr:LysR family transcriptional regulator [Sphingomonas sp. BK235]TCP29343.1 DNA-binding transcriptional LysR family regulator [Sphingomonas sp. BK235]
MVLENRTIDWYELRAFAAVVRHGGVTAAAKALHASKSTVSLQISRLEMRLGTRLLERSSRRVALTREGEQVLPRVLSLLAEADDLLEEGARVRSTPRGTVRIAVTPALGAAVLERLLPVLRERHPDIFLAVVSSYDLDDLRDPAFDFAIRVGQVRDESLVAKKVGSFVRILVCAPAHPAAQFTTPETLASTDLLTFSSDAGGVGWHLQAGAEQLHLDHPARLASQDFDLLLRLARQGLGIAAVPEFMAREGIAAGHLVRVLPGWQSAPIDVMLAYRPAVSRISRVSAVLQIAQGAVAGALSDGTDVT